MKSLIRKLVSVTSLGGTEILSQKIIIPRLGKQPSSETLVKDFSIARINVGVGTPTPISFVDGGNSEILGCSAFSLQFIKICSVEYMNQDRLSKCTYSYYCLSTAINESLQIECSPDQKELENIPVPARELQSSENSFAPESACSKACSFARRISELLHVKNLLLQQKKMVVLDGSFNHASQQEREVIQQIKNIALAKRAIILGFSKATSAKTREGVPAGILLEELGRTKNISPPWTCIPKAASIDGFKACFVKLSKKSVHVFRVDFLEEQEGLLAGALGQISRLSSDPVFPGYPYGLIDADEHARVSDQEKNELLASVISSAGEKWEDIERALTCSNAHSILDRARF